MLLRYELFERAGIFGDDELFIYRIYKIGEEITSEVIPVKTEKRPSVGRFFNQEDLKFLGDIERKMRKELGFNI